MDLLSNLQHRIELWVQNDAGLYEEALRCEDGEELKEGFLIFCVSNDLIATEIIDTVFEYIDWNAVLASVKDEE